MQVIGTQRFRTLKMLCPFCCRTCVDHRIILVIVIEPVSCIWLCTEDTNSKRGKWVCTDWRASELFSWHPNLCWIGIQKTKLHFFQRPSEDYSKMKEVTWCRYSPYAWYLRVICVCLSWEDGIKWSDSDLVFNWDCAHSDLYKLEHEQACCTKAPFSENAYTEKNCVRICISE